MERKEAIVWLVVGIVRDAIQEAGQDGIPSGHLYAMLIDKMSLETYQGIINTLKKAGMVTEVGHMLRGG